MGGLSLNLMLLGALALLLVSAGIEDARSREIADWKGADMKAVISQTVFTALATNALFWKLPLMSCFTGRAYAGTIFLIGLCIPAGQK